MPLDRLTILLWGNARSNEGLIIILSDPGRGLANLHGGLSLDAQLAPKSCALSGS